MGLFWQGRKMSGFTDEASLVDHFGIGKYISGLSDFILDCNTPMTVSIQGAWGCGKTSLMLMIQEQIKDKAICVNFNTWQFSQFDLGDMLPFSMLQVMLRTIGGESLSTERLYSSIKSIATNVAKAAVKTYSGIDLGGGGGSSMGADLAYEISNLKDKLMKVIDEKLKEQNLDRVVVFVDDLDRLPPERAVELLEVLKIFLDCKGCVFVLAIDSEVIFRGVRKKYGFGEKDTKKSQDFFDKIIQVPFIMPVVSYNIESYVAECLKDIDMAASDDDLHLYTNLIRNSIGINPRAIKRLLNSYLLLTKISPDNSNQSLLFAALCLQYLNGALYNFIVINRDNLEPEDFVKLVTAEEYEDLKDLESKYNYSFDSLNDEDSESLMIKINSFMVEFGKLISSTGNEEEITDEDLGKLRTVLSMTDNTTITGNFEGGKSEENDEASGGEGGRKRRTRKFRLRASFKDKVYKIARNLVRDVVLDYINNHQGITGAQLIEAFPDDLQGTFHVIRNMEEVTKNYANPDLYFYYQLPLELPDGTFVICKMWSTNIKGFMEHANEKLGYNITYDEKGLIRSQDEGEDAGDEDETQPVLQPQAVMSEVQPYQVPAFADISSYQDVQLNPGEEAVSQAEGTKKGTEGK